MTFRTFPTSSPHWTAEEIHRLMLSRGLDRRGLSVAAGVSYSQVCAYLSGKCVLTIQNIEKLLKALGHDLDILSDGSPNPAIACLYCGKSVIPVQVHGHLQCPRCQAILERCCED